KYKTPTVVPHQPVLSFTAQYLITNPPNHTLQTPSTCSSPSSSLPSPPPPRLSTPTPTAPPPLLLPPALPLPPELALPLPPPPLPSKVQLSPTALPWLSSSVPVPLL
ncbi:uncharacterized protein CC84DRAFT_1263573, partial [Paraphaeosphaeria sporulosa]